MNYENEANDELRIGAIVPTLSQAPPGEKSTWITAAEAASVLHLSLRAVANRAAAGKLNAKVSEEIPFTSDGKQNYLIRLESLPQRVQLEYLRAHLPGNEVCSLDLATPRSSFGNAWLTQFIDAAQIIREATDIRETYKHSGEITDQLRKLAESHGISLATLYRLCGKASARQLSVLYLDPIYLQAHLPKTMCLWSADFAYALYLDRNRSFSQNSIFRELKKRKDVSCTGCPYWPERDQGNADSIEVPACRNCQGTMLIPRNRKTLNRLLARIPSQALCYARKGVRQWDRLFGHFALREKPLFVNELWQGDHHVFDLFVRVRLARLKNDRSYEQEIAVRPVLTAWMDTATGCIVGRVISILPNADTIAEAFCRAVALTVGDEFHGLPKAILVDCGKDYRSSLLEDLPENLRRQGDDTPLDLNRRFAGLGLLPALGVEVHHALPYHPQSKSIERFFGTLEREWICKLKGWCRGSVSERPEGFQQELKKLLANQELLTLEQFVDKFQKEILPAYHHFREDTSADLSEDGWQPALRSMSPLERYHALEKSYLVTPDWNTLSALKLHHAPERRIQRYGIKFQNVWYWDDQLSNHIGSDADIFYHAVERPLAPSSITVTVNGEFVCEAFPAHKLPFHDAPAAGLQAHLDAKRRHNQEMRKTLERIKRSAAGILPPDMTEPLPPEKVQLRDMCYSAAVLEQAPALPEGVPPSSGSPDSHPVTGAPKQKSSPSNLREMLSFLFGE